MKVYKRASARENVQTLDSRMLLESRIFELDPEIKKISEFLKISENPHHLPFSHNFRKTFL